MTGAGQLWSWALTAVGVLGIYLAGRRRAAGWAVSVSAQALWLAYAVATRQWGFIFSALVYAGFYGHNWRRWRRESTLTPPHRTELSAVPTPDRRPDIKPPYAELYDWLAANGVDEWVPEAPAFRVDPAAGTLTYTAYVWKGPRGWSGEQHIEVDAEGPLIEQRTVPLVAPPSDRIRELIPATGATLEETGR